MFSSTRSRLALAIFITAALISGFFIATAYANALPPTSNITVTQPDGTQYWRGTQTIQWNVATTTGLSTVNLYYSTDFSSYQNLVPGGVSQPISLSGSYDWDTTGVSDGSGYSVKVSDDGGEFAI